MYTKNEKYGLRVVCLWAITFLTAIVGFFLYEFDIVDIMIVKMIWGFGAICFFYGIYWIAEIMKEDDEPLEYKIPPQKLITVYPDEKPEFNDWINDIIEQL